MVEHGATACSGEIEVGVIGEVDGRGFVSRGLILDDKCILLGEHIDDAGVEIAGEALVAILAEVGQAQSGSAWVGDDFRFPNDLAETLQATVQVKAGLRMQIQRVGLAVEVELAACDAIGHAPGDAAEKHAAVVFFVFGHRIESERDVGDFARAIRHMQFRDDTAQGDDLGGKAMLVLQGVTLDGFAIASGAEVVFDDFSLSGDEADG